jgi:hypothetical protein
VPKPERVRDDCYGDDENTEKQKGVRPAQKEFAGRLGRGAPARTVPSRLMDGSHAARLGTTGY